MNWFIRLFKNVGKKLRGIAMGLVFFGFLEALAAFIVGCWMTYDIAPVCILIVFFGPPVIFFLNLFVCYLLYGYGEIVENVSALKNIDAPKEEPLNDTAEDDELPEL